MANVCKVSTVITGAVIVTLSPVGIGVVVRAVLAARSVGCVGGPRCGRPSVGTSATIRTWCWLIHRSSSGCRCTTTSCAPSTAASTLTLGSLGIAPGTSLGSTFADRGRPSAVTAPVAETSSFSWSDRHEGDDKEREEESLREQEHHTVLSREQHD
jgi:hypothetical protein